MFAKATTNLLCEVDPEGALVAVHRLNDSDKLAPLALVIKRHRFWFWQRCKYLPTGFCLNDLLEPGSTPIQPVVEEKDFLKYSGTFGEAVSGTVQAEVGSVGGANMALEGKRSSKLQSSFGTLRKQELDVNALLQDSKDKRLDLEHDLMEQVREKRRRVIGLVRERVFTTQECSVCEEVDDMTTCSGLIGLFTPTRIKVSVKHSGNLESDSNVSLTIPANTTLAYSLIELEIKAKGRYELCLLQDLEGGFESDSVDTVHTVHKRDLLTVSSAPNHTHTSSLLTALEQESRQLSPLAGEPAGTRTLLLQGLSELMRDRAALDNLEQALEKRCDEVTPDLPSLEKAPSTQAQVTSVLRLLPPDAPRPLVSATHLLVSALDEMSDEGLTALSSCCTPPVLQALQQLVLSLASEGACSPVGPALAEEAVFPQVQLLFAASGVTLHREAGTVKVEGGALTGRLPLVMGIAVTGLAALVENK
ncbi:gasdermin Eb [Sardina pilchardus]|uniref:gasdermin Eb n=1 Tax=Sardina pilchardus TaxID=27697 RepID=UPI002E107AAB